MRFALDKIIKYPLINFENGCDKSIAIAFVRALKLKTDTLKKQSNSAKFKPYFAILKTKKDTCFGVIVSKETRYHFKNILHKSGYKSHRISYPEKIFDDTTFINFYPQFNKNKMVTQEFTSLQAYTLSLDGELANIGHLYFSKTPNKKHSETYVDGLFVPDKPNYRHKGIAKALVDYAHSLFEKHDIQYVCADAKKIDKSGFSYGEYRVAKNPESDSFKMLLKYGYKIENMNYYQDTYRSTTPLKGKVKDIVSNDNGASKNVKIPLHQFLHTEIHLTK